ncbi:MAG: arginine--tRNA ligase [Thermoplasmatales archaeon]|nr:arginine--tRNA ligase [Thermoplasmatales archaeon]
MNALELFAESVGEAVRSVLGKRGLEACVEIVEPTVEGVDLAVPCFPLAKAMGKAPKTIAEELASEIEAKHPISGVEASNGYLNFTMDHGFLVRNVLGEIISKGDDYGRKPPTGLRVNVEHTSTNPTGPIHVGRARNPIIGDTLARVLKAVGHEVTTEYYVNDVGKQVVILSWGVRNIDPGDVDPSDRDKADHNMVPYYREANRRMEEDPAVAEEISELLRRFEIGDREVIDAVGETAAAMIDGLRESLSEIGVELDVYTWESKFILDGSAADIVARLKESEHAGTEGDGSWYLDLKDFGIKGKNTRFTFTRSDGTTLYTTRDLAYHMDKFKRADRVIDVLGEDQKLGSRQLCAALEILGCEKQPEAIFYSFVSLAGGTKMSTRRGTVVYLDDLIDEAVEMAYGEVAKRRADLSEGRMREIARVIGIGAIRYNIVRVQPDKQMVFNWNEALNFEGNSAPFLQYAHARACTMIGKAGGFREDTDPAKLTDPSEIRLVKALSRFGKALEVASTGRVHLLPSYGQEVASAFNQFYASVPVLSAGRERDARLTLTQCARVVLRNVLGYLGIGAPEEM